MSMVTQLWLIRKKKRKNMLSLYSFYFYDYTLCYTKKQSVFIEMDLSEPNQNNEVSREILSYKNSLNNLHIIGRNRKSRHNHSPNRSEKNASGWSKEKIKSLFEGMVLEEPGLGKCTAHSSSTLYKVV